MKQLIFIFCVILFLHKIEKLHARAGVKKCASPGAIKQNLHAYVIDESALFATTEVKENIDEQEIIYLRPLGAVDDEDIETAAGVLRDFFGYEVYIQAGIHVNPEMLGENGEMDSYKACRILNQSERTVYILDRLLYQDGKLLRGCTSGNDNTILVRGELRFLRETLIHEIGHSLGLSHCDDLTCVMALNNDNEDSGDFCSICKDKIYAEIPKNKFAHYSGKE